MGVVGFNPAENNLDYSTFTQYSKQFWIRPVSLFTFDFTAGS